jgi:hypothetical protein
LLCQQQGSRVEREEVKIEEEKREKRIARLTRDNTIQRHLLHEIVIKEEPFVFERSIGDSAVAIAIAAVGWEELMQLPMTRVAAAGVILNGTEQRERLGAERGGRTDLVEESLRRDGMNLIEVDISA